MPQLPFLKKVLPNEGYKCWVEIDSAKKVTQGLVETTEELADKLTAITARGSDAYFGCAVYVTPQNRRANNALGAGSFWLDLDVGEGKGYATIQDAIQACDEFCGRLHLDVPGLVRSGNGLHAYWTFGELIPAMEWTPIAQRLKLLTEVYGLRADPTRTADIASILRPAGSKNFKIPSRPLEVSVDDWDLLEPIDFKRFRDVVMGAPVPTPKNANLAAGIHISKVAEISNGVGEGGRNQACASYAGALFAKGGAADFVLEECLKWNHKNVPPLDEHEIHTTVNSIARRHVSNHPVPQMDTTHTLPTLPKGFKWNETKQLTVYTETVSDLGEKMVEWRAMSPLPVYLEGVLNMEGYGDRQANSFLFANWHPLRGWLRFSMSAKELHGNERFAILEQNGVTLYEGMRKYFDLYLTRSITMLREQGKEGTQYTQFGWKEDGSFLIGNHLCKPDGSVELVTGSSKLLPYIKALQPDPKGSLDAWSAAANKLYAIGSEAQGAMALSSFAAALMPFCVDEGNGGSIFSIVSEDSGYGKTPMANAMASVWGEASGIVLTGNTTENHRIEDIVRKKNLPQVREENSYPDPILAALGVEKLTSGTDRGRLTRDGAAQGLLERYQTIVISLSNKSLYELVRMVNVPMAHRVFEIEIERPTKEVLENLGGITRAMMANRGHAGLAFARLIVNPEIKKYIELQLRDDGYGGVGLTVQKYRKLLASRPEHRFIVWLLATMEVAAHILVKYGILCFDIDRIMNWVGQHATARTTGDVSNEAAFKLNQFLSEHIGGCITVQGAFDPKKANMPPLRFPTRNLCMRMEMKTARLYIDNDTLKRWCAKHNTSFINMGRKLTESGILTGRSRAINLGAGTEIPSMRALCWEIDMSHPEVSNQVRLEVLTAPEKKLMEQLGSK